MSIFTMEQWRHTLQDGDGAQMISSLQYQVAQPKARYLNALETFQSAFGRKEAALFSAPGRTELSGNHTDHQLGRVLAGSVSFDMIAAAAPRKDHIVSLLSEGYPPFKVDISSLEPRKAEQDHTAGLVRGVAAGLTKLGHSLSGIDIYITSSVPKGSGLSSSAAFEILIGTVFNHLCCGGSVDDITLAKIGQQAENAYFGKPSGLLDQMGCALGGVTAMDFGREDLGVVRLQPDFTSAGYQLFVVNAGGSHANLTHEYAAIPAEMRSVAAALGSDVLGHVEEQIFYDAIPTLRGKVSDRALLRAIHFYEENKRVDLQVDALQRGDYEAYRKLMTASGQSSYDYLQNIYPSGDVKERSVSLALCLSERLLDGKGASRVQGGGFAGTIQALVPIVQVDEYVEKMERCFGKESVSPLLIRPVGGVCIA